MLAYLRGGSHIVVFVVALWFNVLCHNGGGERGGVNFFDLGKEFTSLVKELLVLYESTLIHWFLLKAYW